MTGGVMDQVTFGAYLRSQRERRGISLGTIAQQTKVSASILEGLERGDLSGWPPGIYRRAFVRTYATAIGLDPEDVVGEFRAVFPEPSVRGGDQAGGRPTRSRARPGTSADTSDRTAAPSGPSLRLTFEDGSGQGVGRTGAARRLLRAGLELGAFVCVAIVGRLLAGPSGFWVGLGLAAAFYHLACTLFGTSPVTHGPMRIPEVSGRRRRGFGLAWRRARVSRIDASSRAYDRQRRFT